MFPYKKTFYLTHATLQHLYVKNELITCHELSAFMLCKQSAGAKSMSVQRYTGQ
jgi:hypothetical protein